MPRNPAETRTRIMSAAYALFFRKGFQRTSLDEIAAKAGVTKRTLYYHVRSKDELAGAMLVHQNGFVLDQMSRWLGSSPQKTPSGARVLVNRLFGALGRWAEAGQSSDGQASKEKANSGRWTGSGFTRMAMELADLPGHPARVATRRHKAQVQAELARRFAGCGLTRPFERAAQVQMLLEGAMVLILIDGDAGHARQAAAAARKLI